MARTVKDAALETRAARHRLTIRSEPHWRAIDAGLALGYRKSKSGGTWLSRRWLPEAAKYREQKIGSADDFTDADGSIVLTFSQAQTKAREWWIDEARRDNGHAPRGPYSVADACRDYRADYTRRSGRDLKSLRSAIDGRILPALGAIDLPSLTAKKIREWHHAIAQTPRRTRTRSDPTTVVGLPPDLTDPETVRRRRSSANRVLTVLKAALNLAFAEGHVASDEPWRRVLPFQGVDVARVRYLTEPESARLLNAAAGPFRELVAGALTTGARYGELSRLKVADVDLKAGTIFIRESKSGRPRHIALAADGLDLFDRLTFGRDGNAPVFRRVDGRAWRASEQARPLLAACEAARISPPITFHGLRDTYASTLAMRGVPMAVIAAQLGHVDTRITEKHYAHLAPSYVADTIRAALPGREAGKPGSKVRRLSRAASK